MLSDGTVIGQVGTTGYVDHRSFILKFAKAELVNPRELIS